MQLFFIHNILIRILKHPDLVNMGSAYEHVYNYRPHILSTSILTGHILIQVEPEGLKQLLIEISQISSNKPTSITILLNSKDDVFSLLQQYFKIINAAGGIVTKRNQLLMIYRAHTWDLPKGRIEAGEATINAAIREVHEECGVKAVATAKFYTTWHAFQVNRVNVLKETTWYTMNCIDDTHMAPQKEEAIDRVAWIDINQLTPILENTYASIKLLLQAYQNHIKLTKTLDY
ncbi:MAG: NUDIX hydrolase [Candidatus Amoebophilus sp.]